MSASQHILYIKNMVCPRCKHVVKQIFEDLECHVLAVELGQVVIQSRFKPDRQQIEERLVKNGFELITTANAQRVERIKALLIHLFYWSEKISWPVFWPGYLEMDMRTEFKYLDQLFFSECGYTIGNYVDLLRFERAKELVSYCSLSTQHIADQLGYGDPELLSLEFGKKLNLTLDDFKKSPNKYRVPLDKLGQN